MNRIRNTRECRVLHVRILVETFFFASIFNSELIRDASTAIGVELIYGIGNYCQSKFVSKNILFLFINFPSPSSIFNGRIRLAARRYMSVCARHSRIYIYIYRICVYAIYSDVVLAVVVVFYLYFVHFRYIRLDWSEIHFLYMSQCLPSAYNAHRHSLTHRRESARAKQTREEGRNIRTIMLDCARNCVSEWQRTIECVVRRSVRQSVNVFRFRFVLSARRRLRRRGRRFSCNIQF